MTDCEMKKSVIRPCDIVLHRPSGEMWKVCGVDPTRDELIPCGYPFPSIAKLSDCELIEERFSTEGQPEEYIKALQGAGLVRFIYTGDKNCEGIEKERETTVNEYLSAMSLDERAKFFQEAEDKVFAQPIWCNSDCKSENCTQKKELACIKKWLSSSAELFR